MVKYGKIGKVNENIINHFTILRSRKGGKMGKMGKIGKVNINIINHFTTLRSRKGGKTGKMCKMCKVIYHILSIIQTYLFFHYQYKFILFCITLFLLIHLLPYKS